MPVTDLAFGGRKVEDQHRVNRSTANQTAAKTSTIPAKPADPPEERPASPVDLEAAIDPLKKAFEAYGAQVDIQYRDEEDMLVIVLYATDPKTGQKTDEIVRQIPPEEAVELARRLEQGKAMFLDGKI
jgi:uncharacterized FlaG/YvyC family protein